MRKGFIIMPSMTMSEPGTIVAATRGKAAEDGSAGTMTCAGRSSGRPSRLIFRPCAPKGSILMEAPKCRSIFSVWSRVASASITARAAGRVETGEEHRGFDLRRGHRRRIFDRNRLARALEQHRAASARRLRQDLGAHQRQGIENPPHRALAQARRRRRNRR